MSFWDPQKRRVNFSQAKSQDINLFTCTFKHQHRWWIRDKATYFFIYLLASQASNVYIYVMNASLYAILIFPSHFEFIEHSIYDRLQHNFHSQSFLLHRRRHRHNRARSLLACMTWEMNYLAKNILFTRIWQVKLLSSIVLKCILALNAEPRMMHAWMQTWYAQTLQRCSLELHNL